VASAFANEEKEKKPAKGKRLLILGGTAFLGPELVAAAKAKGWTITLFNRGKTNPQLFPDLEKLHGDRENDLKSLEGKSWDAVVDTSAYFPRNVKLSAELLSKAVKQYVLISTISVYTDTSKPGMDETAPVGKVSDEEAEKAKTVRGELYGPLKAMCETAAEKAMPGRVTVIRPGLIVGPNDPTDRFTYWPVRVDRGGEVLAPGTPKDPIQFIDVRDLAEWTIRMIESGSTGTYNATGPKSELTIGALLSSCKAVAKSDAAFTWADADFLEAQKVSAWGDMPVWVPPVGDSMGFSRISNKRALDKGITFRSVDVTAKDTLDWWKAQPAERRAKMKAGISPEREAAVLKAWHEKGGKDRAETGEKKAS
ncbi:MAG TPA: NAD-dependent epimerase/dehydratase family protein, partial [Thermoanaerobaculia bacterium]|nr:NAD-dependent epimerase/dehydratase family protein [Thermoanaerobaculia bacterium]